MAIKTVQDTFADATRISSQSGTEVSSGVLQNKDVGSTSTYTFDGTNDLITVADANNLTFGNGTADSAFSISFWVVFQSISGTRAVIAKATNAAAGEYYCITSANLIYFRLVDNSAAAFIGVSCPMTDVGIWKFVTLTYSGAGSAAGLKIYLDGALQPLTTSNSGSYTAMENLTTTLRFGERVVGSEYFSGLLEDVAIYNAELTSDNVRDLFLKASIPSDFGSCVSYWPLNGNANDSVGTNHGTISGPTAITSYGSYTKVGQTVSSSKMGASGVKSVTNFSYTNTQKAGSMRRVIQFSNDNSTWVNSSNKSVVNTGCYSFDGVNDYIDFGDISSIWDNSTNTATFCAWVKTCAIGTQQAILSKYNSQASALGLALFSIEATGKIRFLASNADASNFHNWVTTNQVINDATQWHFVCATINLGSGVGVLYVDGVVVPNTKSTTGTGPTTFRDSATSVKFGKYTTSGGSDAGFYNGLIDGVSIYSSILTQSQIQALMTGTTLPSDIGTCVSWWKLDGNANDSVGANNGTVNGATSVTDWWRLKQLGDVTEAVDTAYFDGTGDYVNVANESNFDFQRTDTFSLGGWVKSAYTANSMIAIGKIQNTGNLAGYQLVVLASGLIRLDLINTFPSNHLRVTTSVASVNDGLWHHIIATYDGSSTPGGIKIYRDGVECVTTTDSNTLSASILNNEPVQMSGRGNAATTPWFGSLANMAIWNDVRTANEVMTDFQNGYFDSSDANMVSGWVMNEGTGTTITDVKGANNGTVNGTNQWIKDEFRPVPASPTQQTISLSSIGGAWTDFYYRIFSENETGQYTLKTTEVTLEYVGGGGGLLLRKVGS